MIEQYDDRQGYCRMLGHTLGFQYCRTMNSGLPCHNILNCWFERIEIEDFMRENYSPEQLQSIFAPPRSRIDAVLEAVAQAEKDGSK
jgi:hypothetical protein